MPCGWHLLQSSSRRGHTGLLRSQFPWLTSVGRCSPPGLSAVQTGQYRRLPAPYPVPFGSSASASCAGSRSRWLSHTFACAARRCLRDGIPGVRLPGSAFYPRSRPLRTSRRPGGYAVTPAPGGRDFHPHEELSYKADALRLARELTLSFSQRIARKCKRYFANDHCCWRTSFPLRWNLSLTLALTCCRKPEQRVGFWQSGAAPDCVKTLR